MVAYPILNAIYYLVFFVVVFGTYLNYSANNDIPDCYSTASGGYCIAGNSGCINVTLRWHKLCALGLVWASLLWIVVISCCTFLRAERGGKIAIISSFVVVALSFSWMITATIFLYDAPGQACSNYKVSNERYFLVYVMSILWGVYGLVILILLWFGVIWIIKRIKECQERHPYAKTNPMASGDY